jgi:anti-sigma regulatory factor (Ser/Thr protein kinase)
MSVRARIPREVEEQVSLQADISQVAQVSSWLERLSARYGIPDKVRFASNLCLEEVLSNTILHGYGGAAAATLMISFAAPRPGCFVFVVEDEAPHFNPVEHPELPALSPDEDIRVGGQGLRLLRKFAGALEYEPLPAGNRLKIFFSS